jgi:nicotinate-nucleotide pyrophosphorylase (carboxylating)
MCLNKATAAQLFLARDIVKAALVEDIGGGDWTTAFLVDPGARGTAAVTAKQQLVVAGMTPFLCAFSLLDESVECTAHADDGTVIQAGDTIAELCGPLCSLLTAERTALNFLQRLSGIATLTAQFVEKAERFGATILDTRKTTAGLRFLEKEAVRAGGGKNHRMGLYDAVLIKENHLAASGAGIAGALERIRQHSGPHMCVEIEVGSLDEFREALAAQPDMILLDNMPCQEVKQAVLEAAGRVPLEVSGNVTLETVEKIAATGVQYISVVALTHSAPAADVSMLIEPAK